VDAYRQVKPGVFEWWSTYSLQLNTEREPEPVTSGGGTAAAASEGAGTASTGGAADENRPRQPSGSEEAGSGGKAAAAPTAAVAAKGKRYRLLPLSESQQRALPADGKITVLYGGHTCEAQLSLPASETRCVASGRVGWGEVR